MNPDMREKPMKKVGGDLSLSSWSAAGGVTGAAGASFGGPSADDIPTAPVVSSVIFGKLSRSGTSGNALSGITGPGLAPSAAAIAGSVLVRSVCTSGSTSARWWRPLAPWVWAVFDIEDVYTASMPSGMITTSDVPTNTPIPTAERSRSCDCERLIESGSAPARNDL